MFWNNMNVSLITKFCINKQALWLLVSQAARFSRPSWPGSFPFLASFLYPLLVPVHHRGRLPAPPIPAKQLKLYRVGSGSQRPTHSKKTSLHPAMLGFISDPSLWLGLGVSIALFCCCSYRSGEEASFVVTQLIIRR